jgi:WD40 repeat protein
MVLFTNDLKEYDLNGHSAEITFLQFQTVFQKKQKGPQVEVLISCSRDGTVLVWDVETRGHSAVAKRYSVREESLSDVTLINSNRYLSMLPMSALSLILLAWSS